jgi:hypothetical protein
LGSLAAPAGSVPEAALDRVGSASLPLGAGGTGDPVAADEPAGDAPDGC